MLSSKLLNEIKKKSELFNSLKPLTPENQAKLDKKFRLEFNFNSNHLEGNTLTYGETELLLIFDQTEGTHDFREYQEMQAHDFALKMVQEEAAEKGRPLLENFIRDLNAKLLVKPFWKDAITADGQSTRKEIIPGEYKKTPNSVRLANGEIFDYTAPGDVQNEIAELVKWFNEKSETEDPVFLAALLHYRFVRIHPFDDGNGRTARLLMNYVLAKNNLPLIVIKSAEKKDYLAALNRADTGDLNAFVEYIGNQLLWSLDLSIKAAKGENIDEDDDLDKELELLKQELKGIPDEFESENTHPAIAQIMHRSIIPLYIELDSKFDKLKELFNDIKSYLTINYEDSTGSSLEIDFDKTELSEVDFSDYKIHTSFLYFKCLKLKKSTHEVNINFTLEIYFDANSYGVFNENNGDILIDRSYGKFLTHQQINNISKSVMTKIIQEIKSATNLKN
ncbi:Fic family protein [Pedobacter sp. N23S346]|uniref:Fic family protein n=1 Tax=Pedobacter sp. N23S346 TaxID=3402750 RepID=UPI003AC51A88